MESCTGGMLSDIAKLFQEFGKRFTRTQPTDRPGDESEVESDFIRAYELHMRQRRRREEVDDSHGVAVVDNPSGAATDSSGAAEFEIEEESDNGAGRNGRRRHHRRRRHENNRRAAVAAAAAVAAKIDAQRIVLQQERLDNDSHSLTFRRSCGVCLSPDRRVRAVYTGCGHVVCLPCAKEQAIEAMSQCPFCRITVELCYGSYSLGYELSVYQISKTTRNALSVSFLALTCCGGPASAKASYNQSSMDQDRNEDEQGPRKITIIEAENINADVKSRTLEEERRGEMRRKQARENVIRARERARKSKQDEENKKNKKRKKSPVDSSSTLKAEEKKGRKKGKKNPDSNVKLVSSSEPFSKQSEVVTLAMSGAEREATAVDESNNGGGGSKVRDLLEDSVKGSKEGSKEPSNEKMTSTEQFGTNETMFSRDRLDELDSAKFKHSTSPSPNNSPCNKTMSIADTQIDSDKPKKRSPANPPKPKKHKKQSKKKEEEVRAWNAMIATGSIFRPRKDDETIDEVKVDWNAPL